MIQKIAIRNYRKFREFDLEFSPGMNIVVGDNDTGKSTLIEAINLALSGRVHGRFLSSEEFSPFLLNLDATKEYIDGLQAGEDPGPAPPELIIELYLEDSDETEPLRGTNNLFGENACGIRIHGFLDPDFAEEYASFLDEADKIRLAPTEYFKVQWLGFDGNPISRRNVPATASVIDPTAIRLQSGADYHLQQIIRERLDPKERAQLSLQYRSLRESFAENPAVDEVNKRLSEDDLTDRHLSLSIDISRRFTWESSLVAHLDDLPFPYIGKGDQNAVKTLLAIGRKAEDAHIVLIEEPENHLAHGSLRKLTSKIEDRCEGKQVIVATHSSFVLNKLGLDRLILLGTGDTSTRITDLPEDTADYFKKLSGYDTLRLVLAPAAILVEGPSDELMVQRAYHDAHDKFPIEDGIDVISVRGLSFKRFLDVSIRLNRKVTVVTDNDGKTVDEVLARYEDYVDHEGVSVHVGDEPHPTLEPQMLAANDLETLNDVLGTEFDNEDALLEYMKANKTSVALAIFESGNRMAMPEYIRGAVA